MELLSESPAETEALGRRLAGGLREGDVVLVEGDLGTGKTTFVRGACRGLGITQPVTSPTYTIGNRYAAQPPVSHLDLYRFERMSASDWGDLEPYFEGAIVFVEWPAAGTGALPTPRVTVRLEHIREDTRRVVVDSDDPDLLARLL